MSTVEVSEADRNAFRDRFKAAIKSAKTSAKQLEVETGQPKGSFLKIYKGKVPLTRELLMASSEILGVDPASLVTDTAYSELAVVPASEPETASPPQPEVEATPEPVIEFEHEPVNEGPTEIEDDNPPSADSPTEVEEDEEAQLQRPDAPTMPEEYESKATDLGSYDRELSPDGVGEYLHDEDAENSTEESGEFEDAEETDVGDMSATRPKVRESAPPPPKVEPKADPGIIARMVATITGLFS